jgi:hypothetical protein
LIASITQLHEQSAGKAHLQPQCIGRWFHSDGILLAHSRLPDELKAGIMCRYRSNITNEQLAGATLANGDLPLPTYVDARVERRSVRQARRPPGGDEVSPTQKSEPADQD